MERHAGDLRFVAPWNRWLLWDGQRWQFEETLRAWDFAREVCREAAAQSRNRRTASTIASAKTVYAVERLARSDLRLAAVVDQWDRDPWLLNTPNGVIDLRTGILSQHRAEYYQTKIAAVGASGDCLSWRKRVSWLRRMTSPSAFTSTKETASPFSVIRSGKPSRIAW